MKNENGKTIKINDLLDNLNQGNTIIMSCSEFFDSCSPTELGLSNKIALSEVKMLVKAYEKSVEEMNIVLTDSIEEYLIDQILLLRQDTIK